MRMIGVDVGGTFTDAVLYDERSGELRWGKAPSTPADPSGGVLAALARNDADLAQAGRFVHGITIGTNAILERKGASVWMLVTRGFRDTLEIARTNRSVLYDIRTLKPEPLVPRSRAIEVDERVLADGTVLRALDLSEVRKKAEFLKSEPPAALAVCFLHSYRSPEHEEEATALLRERLVVRSLAHEDALGPRARIRQHAGMHEVVVYDRVRARQQLAPAHGDQTGIARARANQEDCAEGCVHATTIR